MSRLPKLRAGDSAPRWRALLCDPGNGWQQVPLQARAVASEMLRRLDVNNAIVAQPGRSVVDAVCFSLGASAGDRRVVRKALEVLEAGRWIEMRSDRLVAYFPDLGSDLAPVSGRTPTGRETDTSTTSPEHGSDVTRAQVGRHSDTDRTPVEHESSTKNELTPTPDTKHGVENREEKRREEERRGEEIARAREAPPPDPLGRLVEDVRKATDRGFRATGRTPPPWFGHFESREWTELARWLRAEFPDPLTSAERLGREFALDPNAQAKGHASWLLAGRNGTPGKYLAHEANPSSFAHVDPNVNPADLLESA